MWGIDWGVLTAPCTQLLGAPALYLPAAGGQVFILGVFDEAYMDVVLDTAGEGMNSPSPVLGMQPRDLPAPPLKGDRVKIAPHMSLEGIGPADLSALAALIAVTGDLYTIKDVRPDSHGGAILMLNFTPSAAA